MKPETCLLTIEQAAALGDVSADTLRYWIRTGKLDAVRKDSRVLILRGTLESVLLAVCPVCGERFRRHKLRAKFCSGNCRKRAFRAMKGAA